MDKQFNFLKRIQKSLLFMIPIAILAAVIFLGTETVNAATTGTVTADSLFVRKGPGTGYDILTVNGNNVYLAKGDYVAVSYEEKGWYWVTASFKGTKVEGYVSKNYVTVTSAVPTAKPTNTPVPTKVTDPATGLPEGTTLSVMTYGFPFKGYVVATKLNVRNGAGTGYSIVDSLLEKSIVTVLDSKKASDGSYWYKVQYVKDGVTTTAYTSAAYVAVEIQTAPTATPTPTPLIKTPKLTTSGFPYDGYVVADALNVRSGAGMSNKRIAILMEGDKVTVTAAKKASDGKYWYEIKYTKDKETVTGYVLNEYVYVDVPLPTATPKPSATPTSSVGTPVLITSGFPYVGEVVANEVNVRTDAGTTAKKLIEGFHLNKGNQITIMGVKKAADNSYWYRVAFNLDNKSYEGYVLNSYIYVIVPTPIPTGTPTPTPKTSSAPTPTKRPTATPVSINYPTPVVRNTYDGYPVGFAKTDITGYGKLSDQAQEKQVIYVRPKPNTDHVYDGNGNELYLTKDTVFALYDYYVYNDNLRFRQISIIVAGQYCYGYIQDIYIDEFTGSALTNLKLTPTPIPNMIFMDEEEFDQYLDSQGFPESYKKILTELHNSHPTWVFEAYNTGLYWDESVEKESKAGVNLIPNTYGYELLSTASGAYNWKTEKYTVYDSPYWVTASEGAIAYYMDPRNWLDSKSIFMFESLKYNPSYQTLEQVEALLSGTPFYKKSFTYVDDEGKTQTTTYAQAFIDAAEYSGVSPYHLVTRVRQEVVTSSGTVSNSVSGTVSGYTGYYNFYNIGAYHSTSTGGAIVNGLKYAMNGVANNDEYNDVSLIPWNNEYRAIVGGAYIIAQQYIERGQDTIYLQKFNVTDISTYSHQYMANVIAPYSEGRKLAGAYTNADDLAIVFKIPVFEGMPDDAVKKPASSGCPNNCLSSLVVKTVDGVTLKFEQAFDAEKEQDYYITTSSSNNILQIIATAVCKDAKVGGNGIVVAGASGECFKVTVTAENGDIRTYNIYVTFKD